MDTVSPTGLAGHIDSQDYRALKRGGFLSATVDSLAPGR